MHDVADFLGRHPPFDDLPAERLEELARGAEIEYFPAGETILRQGAEPPDHVWMVRRGAVELVDQGNVLDVLGEGELLGHPSMLSGLPTGFEGRAAEDALCYRLPAAPVIDALARPAGLRFVARSLRSRPHPDSAAAAGSVQRPVGELVREPALIVDPDVSLRDAAQRMSERGARSALVRLRDGGLGIITERDLGVDALAGEIPSDAPVSRVMSAPVFTVAPDRPTGEAVVGMLENGVRHLPVVWPSGEVRGVLDDTDLLAVEARSPFALRREIDQASDLRELRAAAAHLRQTVISVHDAGIPAAQVAAIIAVVADALTRRLITMSIEQRGAPPCPFTWLVLGSFGRREAVPSSDIDSGLVWFAEDDPDLAASVQALGRDVVEGLDSCGFRRDVAGVTADGPLFDRSLAAWRTAIRKWIEDPTDGPGLIYLCLLLDGRSVFSSGSGPDLFDELHDLKHRRSLVRLLLRLALTNRPPTGFMRFRDPPRDLVVEHSGEHRGELNIKAGGLKPIVGLARYASLAAGVVRCTSTRERLKAAATAGTLESSDARTLDEAHDLFWRLRLEHQVEQLRLGEEPDDYLDPMALNELTRTYLRDAFHAVSAVQRALSGELRWG